ncbi:MAG: hypothetical protein IJ967_03180, partial [Phascolarctobacterium sp.]|nr:hypothetical protein [Phascolarctobacterium sp.]
RDVALLLEKVISIVAASAAVLQGSMDAALPDKNIEGNVFLVNRQHSISEHYAPDTRKVNGPGDDLRWYLFL